jgi:predicted nuclease of restriction endonuclease-like (RecB) superfamily
MIIYKKTLETKNYLQTLEDLKSKIKTAQIKAHLAVNKEILILYWQIGKTIIEKQEKEGLGAKIIQKLSFDIASNFPNMKGFSYRNIKCMRQFANAYPGLFGPAIDKNNFEIINIGQQAVAQIPWGHNIVILDKIESEPARIWYATQIIKNGWSRNVLTHQINSNLYQRQAKKEIKVNNFAITLPIEQSEMLQELVKDEYNLEFIDNIGGLIKERKLENAIVDNIVKFLLELGKGFAFVSKQYHLEVGNQDFFIDLLFYHIKLKSYIAIERTQEWQI